VLTGHVIADVNGNLQQSVAASASGYAYLGTANYRDAQVTVQGGSTASAPSAGGTVVSITPGTAGLWEVTATLGISGTTTVAADSNNMALYQTATARLSPIPFALIGLTGAAGTVTVPPVTLNLSASDTVKVQAVGNATGSSVYAASLVARRVG
jgi:hypothetical protein